MGKPREWMIGESCYFPDYAAEDYVCAFAEWDGKDPDVRPELGPIVHVIEYSAYEKCVAALKDARLAMNECWNPEHRESRHVEMLKRLEQTLRELGELE